uniref:Endonuclease/exonuclease/phosphatase domain-containing protein n=1 Tax=Nothobranchius furzeri TaxID=105023 RepID=A0A1A8U3R0_NOTFU
MHADISSVNSELGKHLSPFYLEHNYIIPSKLLLPHDSYAYISEAWHSTSQLDHCFSSSDTHGPLSSMNILYNLAVSDHIPISFSVKVERLPEVFVGNEGVCQSNLNWSNVTKSELRSYSIKTEELLRKVVLPNEAIRCTDPNCANMKHKVDICTFYDRIIRALIESGKPLHKVVGSSNIKLAGWNMYVAGFHEQAQVATREWAQAGRPRQGPLCKKKKKLTHARYK